MNINFDIKTLRPAVRKAIAPTIVAALIFFLTYFVFGAENSMIAPFATLSFLRLGTMRSHYECLVKNYLVYTIMAVLAYFAVMNLATCIVINALALFWIANLLIDEYNPTNYFPMGMALIFFQIAPVATPAALGKRLLALGATFVIIFVFVFFQARFGKRFPSLQELICQGFDACEEILSACRSLQQQNRSSSENACVTKNTEYDHSAANAFSASQQIGNHQTKGKKESSRSLPNDISRKLEALHHRLCDINREISREIYSYNRANLRPQGKANYYCHYILVFQVFNYLTQHFEDGRNLEQAAALYAHYLAEFENIKPKADYHRMSFRLRRPDLRSFRLRFALRQVITLTPCLVFAWASGLENAYWLVISVFFMMIPFTDHTMQRVKQRVLGTIAGTLVCLVLFYLFPGFPARITIMTIANFLIYGANGYGATVAYITCSALAVQTVGTVVFPVLVQRILYTLAGAGIALVANRFIFPIRVKKQMAYLTDMLNEIREKITAILSRTMPGEGRRRYGIDTLTVKSYLLFRRLEDLQGTLPDGGDAEDFRAFEKMHIEVLAKSISQYLSK